MRNNKGITLIALVITIIVLLILAGVSIAMLTGTNGILTQATKTGDRTALEEDREQAGLDVNALVSAYYEQKYVNDNTTNTSNALAYIDVNMKTDTEYYTYTSASHKITLKSDTNVTGTIGTDGTITWSDRQTGDE